MKSLLHLGCLLLLTTVFSQEKTNLKYINYFEKEASNTAQLHAVVSQHYSNPRQVIIQLPLSYERMRQKRYPVVYLLDGERNIKSLTFIANSLARKHKIPEIIIVAIPASNTRQKDYTPNDIPMHSSTVLGDAKTFTKFLKDELTPFIDTTFRTVPYRILSGHSRGGLFAFNDLLDENNIFQAYFAFSPALWAGDFKLISRASQKLLKGSLKNSFFYINAGGDEGAKIKNAFTQFKTLIEEHKPAHWHAAFHENDSHGTTPIPGHYLALRKLYANWDKPWEFYDTEGLKAVKEQHDLLSEEFGYKVIPDENELHIIGYDNLKKGNIEIATAAFKLNTTYHPYSANAFNSYAEGLEAKGALILALNAMEKALSLIKGKEEASSDKIRNHYSALKKKISNNNN